MIKTFTLNKIDERIDSDRVGSMTFHLTDEIGDSRTVTATTFLDENGKARGISSVNKRELPLVQMLFEMELNDTCDLEFKYYNAIFDRDQDKTANQIAYEKVLEMEQEKKWRHRVGQFFKRILMRQRADADNIDSQTDRQSTAA